MKKLLFALGSAILMLTSASAGELLVNGGFESGSLGPWYNARNYCGLPVCVDWNVSTANPHSGLYSATNVDNIELRQDFPVTLGSKITNVSFWIDAAGGFNAVDFFYTDGTDKEFEVFFNKKCVDLRKRHPLR